MGTFCGVEAITILDDRGALNKYIGKKFIEKVLPKIYRSYEEDK